MFMSSSLEFCPSLSPLPQTLYTSFLEGLYYPKLSELQLGQTIILEESKQDDRLLTFYVESSNSIEVILFEGKLKKQVIKSDAPNVGESVTKKRRIEGVSQFRAVLKRGVKYMVEVSGKGQENFGVIGKCEYGKVHASMVKYEGGEE